MSYSNILQLLKNYNALLIANGARPKRTLLTLLNQCSQQLIALDGGVNLLKSFQIVPDVILGDMDSANPEALQWAKQAGSKIVKRLSQEEPDFIKGLRYCEQRGLKQIAVMCADGDRLDHTLISLQSAFCFRSLDIVFITGGILAFPLKGRVKKSFRVPVNHIVSWIPMDKAEGCSLAGTRWAFKNRTLSVGGYYSLSNRSIAEEVQVNQTSGKTLFTVSLAPAE
jgi:thiamine pyrophosphokinase